MLFIFASLLGLTGNRAVVVYECDVLPESAGWEREIAGTPGAEREIADGWFVQTVDLPNGWTGPDGDFDGYRVTLSAFAAADTFFVEWRAITDNPGWLLDKDATPVAVSAAGNTPSYHTTSTADAIQLRHTVTVPDIVVPVVPDVPHTVRLEFPTSNSYTWYLDGQEVVSGTSTAPYPDTSSFLIWGVRRSYVDSTTRWDYIRFGVIPQDGSGDYDSDGALTLFDHYFVRECMADGGPDTNAGPGCRFADFDGDTDADLLDFAEFQNTFGPSHP